MGIRYPGPPRTAGRGAACVSFRCRRRWTSIQWSLDHRQRQYQCAAVRDQKTIDVTGGSQPLVVDAGAICDGEGQAGPGLGPFVPYIDIERAAQIVVVCRDRSA